MPRVLIVDDHFIVRRGLRRIMEPYREWTYCEADRGEAALVAAAEFNPEVVVMDVSMPGMGGLKAAEALHATHPGVKIIILSLHKSSELVRAAFSVGATGYILKSSAEDELIDALTAVIGNETYVTGLGRAPFTSEISASS